MLLREARDRLNADLQREYGVCLTDMYEGRVRVSDVADYAAYLSRGGAVAEWIGGWGAVTAEEEALRRIEYVLVSANSKKRPKFPKPPVGAREVEQNRKRELRVKADRRRALELMGNLYQ